VIGCNSLLNRTTSATLSTAYIRIISPNDQWIAYNFRRFDILPIFTNKNRQIEEPGQQQLLLHPINGFFQDNLDKPAPQR